MNRDGVQVRWDGGLKFSADRADHETRIDGDEGIAPSPVALMVESVAACAAIDVVVILEKGRQELTGLSVRARARRAETAPRYVKGLQFDFHVSGKVDEAKARAGRHALVRTLLLRLPFAPEGHGTRMDADPQRRARRRTGLTRGSSTLRYSKGSGTSPVQSRKPAPSGVQTTIAPQVEPVRMNSIGVSTSRL